MNANDFRKLALTLQGAVESSHMSHPDFRVQKRIFATLVSAADDEPHGVLMLTPEQQSTLLSEHPDVFSPVKGGWGVRGATRILLKNATKNLALRALNLAHGNKSAPARRKR